jgi:phosphatidylglycerol:prolipoprotein diacylglycerol transferase
LRRLHGAHRLGKAKRTITGKDGTVSCLEIPPHDIVPNLTMAVFLSGLVGARVFHIFEQCRRRRDPIAWR